MTSSKATEHLVAPIESWLRQFDELDLKSAPEDFLVGLGSIRKAFVDFYEEGNQAAPLQLLTSLAACEYTLAEEAHWAREVGVEPLQPLSPHWLALVASRAPEMRLAIALNGLQPVETTDEIVTLRSHLESITTRYVDAEAPDATFDDGLSFARRTRVSWRDSGEGDRVWDKQKDVDGLRAVLRRRLDSAYAPFEHAGRGRIPASLADVGAFVRGDLDEGVFSRLVFVLAMLDSSVVETEFEVQHAMDVAIDPDWALLQMALSRPRLDGASGRLPIERDIHLVALRGDRESALAFARAHLREHGLQVRSDLPESDADFDRVVAACAFPVSDETLENLARFLQGNRS